MPQAILTKYLPATNTRPSRIKASCERGSRTITVGNAGETPHIAAASALLAQFAREDAEKYGGDRSKYHWGAFVSGGLPSGDWAHVLTCFPATPKP